MGNHDDRQTRGAARRPRPAGVGSHPPKASRPPLDSRPPYRPKISDQNARGAVVGTTTGNATGTAQAPIVVYDYKNADSVEELEALKTLRRSGEVAQEFTFYSQLYLPRRVPVSNNYWFAKLYELITYFEIGSANGRLNQKFPKLDHPSFLLHFIPVFYQMYDDALHNFLMGNMGKVSALWAAHFAITKRRYESDFFIVQSCIESGVAAHIKGDMKDALHQSYLSYRAKYNMPNPPAFDDFHDDFFDKNRIVFEYVQGSFSTDMALAFEGYSFGIPLGIETMQMVFGIGSKSIGLPMDEIFKWREEAWSSARESISKTPFLKP